MTSRYYTLTAFLVIGFLSTCFASTLNPGCKKPKAGDPDFVAEDSCEGVIIRENPTTGKEEKCPCQCSASTGASGFYCPNYVKRSRKNGQKNKKTTKKVGGKKKNPKKKTTKKPKKKTTPKHKKKTTTPADDSDDDDTDPDETSTEETSTEDDSAEDDSAEDDSAEDDSSEEYLQDSKPAMAYGVLHKIFINPINHIARYLGQV